jgi:glycine/sarcosine N-methyltransferase
MPSVVADSYDRFAEHYHLIFENWEIAIQRQASAIGSVLESKCGLPRSARILDCACGIGTQSLGLAQMGFRVHGSDISSGAIERARLEASQRKLNVHFSVADILDLNSLGGEQFDAVICMDNSLPHLVSTKQLIQAAAQIRARLRHGGFFMASIRDYDRLIEERPVVQGPFFYSDPEGRRIVFQVWDWVDDQRYVFHLYITRKIAKMWETFHMSALYRALRRNELIAALSQAGFGRAFWLEPSETGFYQPIVLAETD